MMHRSEDDARTDGPPPLRLTVAEGKTRGARYTIRQAVVVIGRTDPFNRIFPDIDLSASDIGTRPSLSRRHVEIALTPSGYAARDLDSANGSSVNGRALPGPTEPPRLLRNGDVLRVGRVVLTVSEPGRTASPAPAPLEIPEVSPAPPQAVPKVAMIRSPVRKHSWWMMMAVGALVVSMAGATAMPGVPDLVTGNWTPAGCQAFPDACGRAMADRLSVRIAELGELSGRLSGALMRTEAAVAERAQRLAAHDVRLAALRAARTAARYPAVAAGESFPSAAVLDGRLLAMEAERRGLAEGVVQTRTLRGELSDRLGAAQARRAEAEAQRGLLPVLAARREADAVLADYARIQAGVDALLRAVSAEAAAAVPVLRGTEELLGR
ncbi:FHA domain-containing protein [Azospirillum sp. RWY-5-1]|uniref:FHA domain-containing protein n=1 Tax=Azospirillum oleiclasticum TaxID=2735135 RepID=A0ABX2TN33_9PROT|nr:FHA domain-containing protein [Azospirillum oleiclasticum]NYZ17890.1 FHA domain-containing protein [Azospirillum oleiclasticum]NYZ25098.1 FHA domain-containing protein [Azospirillum oleiclasticum]